VQAYLASGTSMRGARPANRNDELASAERRRGARAPREAERRSASRGLQVAAWSEADYDDLHDPDYGGERRARAKHEYDEFEKLLSMREERAPRAGEPRPEKDTKKAMDARRLKNLQGPLGS